MRRVAGFFVLLVPGAGGALASTALLVGCGVQVGEGKKPPKRTIVEVVEVATYDTASALRKECTKIVARCDKKGVDRVIIIPLVRPNELKVFSCENLLRARPKGCHDV